ncbi:germination protein YpeB [Paenibacillus piri]|uniref:Germination protein YpeB n=1 Tax=Paenibacillus piri TaxID=2547395 RepID=A0A4R5KTW9_9BACL|nr:germination protein YpeB [Paenibacillus piri]TDF99321.1 germination protein YpeB [Paenibacillus piri]
MYKRLSIVMFPILVVALIGAGFWGYLEHQEKNSILIKAENQYQRAFHDLSYHVDRLHNELGNTLAVNSMSQDAYKKGLINVWRITSQAQNEISQLPLTLLPFNKTESFLANLSNFSYRAALRDLNKQPLSQEEMGTLNALYTHAQEISTDLRGMQSKVLEKNLRWMDVETALATRKEPLDNAIIDGFQTVDKKVGDYSDVKWSPSVMNAHQKYDVKMLSGNDVTVDEIKQKAAQFFGLQDANAVQAVENGPGTEYHSFSVSAPKEHTADGIHADYTAKGGQMLWFSTSRDVNEKKLDVRRARDIASEFLDAHGYKNMAAVSYDEYNNIANITFASRDHDVINYLDKLAVKVALDNGEVTGLQATDYVFNHKDRQTAAPKLTIEEARKVLNPNFKTNSEAMALIRNENQDEVLCYQFTGQINGGVYRIYINAENGVEEKIERLGTAEQQVNQT